LNTQLGFPSNTKAAITLSIDDCWENTSLILFELLEKLNICGTFNVIAGFPGKRMGPVKFADWRLLREIAMHGNELASHSLTHKPLNASMMPRLRKIADAARYENPIRLSRRIISLLKHKQTVTNVEHLSFKEELHLSRERIQERTGTSCKTYVYPGGNYDDRYKQMVMKAGYTSARSGHIGYNSARNIDIFALKVQVWDSKVNKETAKRWVNEALSHNHWLIEVIHAVNYPDYIYSANPQDLRSHLEYVADKRNDLWISTQNKIAEFLRPSRKIMK
jgi:peptidoglycan/xylan/chitin deacetylase (PgdA/CDA1 family)